MAFGFRLTVAKYHDHSNSNVQNACNRKHLVHTSTLPTKISRSAATIITSVSQNPHPPPLQVQPAILVAQYHSTPTVKEFCDAKIINAILFQQLQTKKHPIRNDLDKIFVTLHHIMSLIRGNVSDWSKTISIFTNYRASYKANHLVGMRIETFFFHLDNNMQISDYPGNWQTAILNNYWPYRH